MTGEGVMRVLHVLNDVSSAGNGISNVAVDLALEQRRLGHDVFVASAGGPVGGSFLELLSMHGIPHHPVDFRTRTPLRVVHAYRELRSVLTRTQPDIVHVHTLAPTLLGYIATRGRRAGLVATVHNEYQSGVWLMGLADVVVGVSEAVSKAMANRRVPPKKIRTVLNGTVGSVRRPPIMDDQWVNLPLQSVVTVGAVSHRKGADVLLAAFEQVLQHVPQAHLYYIGHVDWTRPVEIAKRQSWGDQVHFVGFEKQPQRYFENATVFALASRRDPMPLGLLEALEAGLPVVASDVDGIPEALEFGRVGLLARVGDPADLARGITRLLCSEEDRLRFARAARERAAAFTVQAMAENYLKVYRSANSR